MKYELNLSIGLGYNASQIFNGDFFQNGGGYTIGLYKTYSLNIDIHAYKNW